jgi:hypothetical protein
MKRPWMWVVGVSTWLLVAGCQTSNSSQGNSSQSNSGQSSGSDSSQSNSGQSGSSEGSGASSNTSGEGLKASGEATLNVLQASEGVTNNSADTTRASSENSGSSQSRSSEATSGPVLSATSVGVTVGGLGLVIWKVLLNTPAAPAPAEVARAAQVYLRGRTHQLREDLALGAGPTIEDLAAMARIRRENLGTFGRLLCAHRGELLALADSATLTPERALLWLERVGQLARTEPSLEEDRRAFLVAHGVLE